VKIPRAEQVLEELAQVRWQTLTTELGILIVQPLNMGVPKIYSDCFTINRVEYPLHGPLYRYGHRWRGFKPGTPLDRDPDFTLLRCDDMSRHRSHAAYRRAVQVIEWTVNNWGASERDIADIGGWPGSGQTSWSSMPTWLCENTGWHIAYPGLFAIQAEYLQALLRDLKCAQAGLNRGDVQAILKPLPANCVDYSDGREHAGT